MGLVWLLAAASSLAGTPAGWFTQVWKTDDGLVNNNIQAAVQGADDYLWVVPSVGLMRFDGVTFSRFPIENLTGPIDTHPCTVLRSRTGVVWVATYGGKVIGLKPDFSVSALPQTGLPRATPLILAEDKEGSLWLGYVNAIVRIKDERITKFTAKEGVPPGVFHSLASDGAGNIWLAKGTGVRCYRDGRFQTVVSDRDAQCLAATRTNAIWFIAGANLFTCDTGGALRDYGACEAVAGATRRSLLQDHTGAVWIGTAEAGLIRYGESGFEKIETSYPSIQNLAEDHEGNIWVSTAGGGLDRVSLNGVRQEITDNNPVLSHLQSVCQDTQGVLWGVTYNGTLACRANNEWTPVFTNAPFAGAVTCAEADTNGAIWIGTRKGELLRLADTNYDAVTQEKSYGAINALLMTSKGDLWVLAHRPTAMLAQRPFAGDNPPAKSGEVFRRC